MASQTSTRPPLQRMMVLHLQLQRGSYPNCRKLSEELEVSAKTIQRDLEFMRDRLGLPIAYEPARAGYRYTEPVVQFPTMEISAGEVVALCVAQMALAQYEGTAFQKRLKAALQKLTEGLQDKISFNWSELNESISFHTIGTTESDLHTFEEISQAVLESRELQFEYRKLGGERFEARRLQPYHLGCIESQWYAIGYDLGREQLRTFALTRMREVRLLPETFRRPDTFSIQEYFSQSFGVFAGAPRTYRIRILFDALAGHLVTERSWHATQKFVSRPHGQVEMQLELCSLREIERWVLSWGGRAKVLAPPDLAVRVRESALAAASRYGG